MKNRLIKIIILILETVLLYVIPNINIGCFFRNNLNIYCPGCGLTRAFLEILNFNFIHALKLNIISIPLFILILIINFILLYDIIFNKNNIRSIFIKFTKYSNIILILLLVSFVINNINKI